MKCKKRRVVFNSKKNKCHYRRMNPKFTDKNVMRNNELLQITENTSKAIKSPFKSIGLVSVQEALAKCSFLETDDTPATAQRCFVLSGQWMWQCVCVCVHALCTCNTGHSWVSWSIIDFPAERERAQRSGGSALPEWPNVNWPKRVCACERVPGKSVNNNDEV